MEEILTPWFAGSVKPVRRGFYERDWGSLVQINLDYWDGKLWHYGDGVDMNPRDVALVQKKRWRGLASKPKGAA